MTTTNPRTHCSVCRHPWDDHDGMERKTILACIKQTVVDSGRTIPCPCTEPRPAHLLRSRHTA